MRIVATSDLHYPYRLSYSGLHELVSQIKSVKPDVVLLAGDLGASSVDQSLRDLFNEFSRISCPVGVVAGNHDTWVLSGYPSDSWGVLDAFCSLARSYGLYPLDQNSYLNVDNLFIVGSISWYDYSFASSLWPSEFYSKMECAGITWMDKYYSKWFNPFLQTNQDICKKFIERLYYIINAINLRNQKKELTYEIIAITHMPVLKDSVLFTGDMGWDFCNAFMGSKEMGDMIEREGIRLHLHGHSHDERRKIPTEAAQFGLHSYNVCYYPHRPFRVFDRVGSGWEVRRYE